MNPGRDLLCPSAEFIEFGSDLGEFCEQELTLFLAQPAGPPRGIAAQTRRGEPHHLVFRTHTTAHANHGVVLSKPFPCPGTDVALNLSCTRPCEQPIPTDTLRSMAELNGVPVTPDELKALALVNYGHFTSMRMENQRIRGFSHHLERLVRDCRVLFGHELDRQQVREYVRQATAGRDGAFVVRVTIYDPNLELGHPGAQAEPKVLVTTRPAGTWPMSPLRVQSVPYVRDLPEQKHVGLFGALWHRRNAQLDGFDDCVFTDPELYLSEGATWNIGFFDGQQVIWPNAEVLPGVTMRLLHQVHDATSLGPVNLSDLPRMEAAFATNTAFGVRAITAINEVEFPDAHPIFETLRKEYEEIPAEAV